MSKKKLPAKKIQSVQLFVMREGRKIFGLSVFGTYESADALARRLTRYLKTGILCVADDEHGSIAAGLDPTSETEIDDPRIRCELCAEPVDGVNAEGFCADCEAQVNAAPVPSMQCSAFVKGPTVHDSLVLMQCVLTEGHEGPHRAQ